MSPYEWEKIPRKLKNLKRQKKTSTPKYPNSKKRQLQVLYFNRKYITWVLWDFYKIIHFKPKWIYLDSRLLWSSQTGEKCLLEANTSKSLSDKSESFIHPRSNPRIFWKQTSGISLKTGISPSFYHFRQKSGHWARASQDDWLLYRKFIEVAYFIESCLKIFNIPCENQQCTHTEKH